MRRKGVRIDGCRRPTGYARIYPGVKDQVTEDRQESLQDANPPLVLSLNKTLG
jgi:hypothetical protein